MGRWCVLSTSASTTSLHLQLLPAGRLFSCMQWLYAADAPWVVREDLQADSFLLLAFLPPVCSSLCCLYSPLTLGCNACVPKQALVVHLLAGGGTCDSTDARSAVCTTAKWRRHKAASSALGMRKTCSVLDGRLMCGAKGH